MADQKQPHSVLSHKLSSGRVPGSRNIFWNATQGTKRGCGAESSYLDQLSVSGLGDVHSALVFCYFGLNIMLELDAGTARAAGVAAAAKLPIYKGQAALQRLSERAWYAVNPIKDQATFSEWCRQSTARRLSTDREFMGRVRVRNLRRQHMDELQPLESRLSADKDAWGAIPASKTLAKFQNQLQGASNAISSMQRLLSSSEQDADPTLATAEGAAAAADKERFKLERIKLLLPEKVREREIIMRSIEQLRTDNYELLSLQESEVAVALAWERIGLTEAIASMSTNVRVAGKNRNHQGVSFEEFSERVIHDNLLPDVARQLDVPVADLFLVRNVCFGMRSSPGQTGEFDILICTRADTVPDGVPMPRGGTFCHVHGVGKSSIVPRPIMSRRGSCL